MPPGRSVPFMETSTHKGTAPATTVRPARCVYSLEECRQHGRHEHEYIVGTYGTRRCSCGNRHFLIKVGGGLPVKVLCDRCRKDNYPATCYEAGRAHGTRQIGGDHDAPGF